MSHLTTHDLLTVWLRDQPEAIAFCGSLLTVAHCWDDLIDKDTTLSDEAINRAMWLALIEIPANGFYRQHFHSLSPILQMGILNWHSANRLESSLDVEHHRFAFVIRALVTDVIAACALLIGGPDWGREVHYAMQVANTETFDEYRQTLRVSQKEVS